MVAPGFTGGETSLSQLVDELRANEDTYHPNDEVSRDIGSKTLGMVVGPSNTGKTTVIQTACKLDPEFWAAGSLTTRRARPDEVAGEYDHEPHTVAGLGKINEQRRRGELVQYVVHPTLDFVYGSVRGHYQGHHNLRPILSTAVAALLRAPFARHHIIGVVTSGPEWQSRFNRSFADASLEEVRGRMQEGLGSLAWGLEQPELHWIVNAQDCQAAAALEIVRLMRGDEAPSASSRKDAENLHAFIRTALADLPKMPKTGKA